MLSPAAIGYSTHPLELRAIKRNPESSARRGHLVADIRLHPEEAHLGADLCPRVLRSWGRRLVPGARVYFVFAGLPVVPVLGVMPCWA
jgi:hypothetical protein